MCSLAEGELVEAYNPQAARSAMTKVAAAFSSSRRMDANGKRRQYIPYDLRFCAFTHKSIEIRRSDDQRRSDQAVWYANRVLAS